MRRKQRKQTKMLPKIAVLLVIVAIIFSIIKLNSTKASTDIVEITNVEIAAKSDTTDVDSVKFEDGRIKNNVEFHKVGDYLTYNVTITNKEDKDYTIKSITDNNGNENLAYSYSGYEGAKLEAKKAAMFQVTITYAKEVEIDKRDQSNLVALTLTFEDEEGNTQEQEVIVDPTDDNKEETTPEKEESKEESKEVTPAKEKDQTPKTGDKVGIYVSTAVVALAILIILSRRKLITNKKNSRSNRCKHGKHGKRILGLILALVLVVPAFSNISKAVTTTTTLSTTLDTTIKFMDRVVVSYEVNGQPIEKVVGYGEAIGDLDEPVKEGYEFKGWTLENGTPVTKDTIVTEDISLTPVFEEVAKTSEITINVENEQTREVVKFIILTAQNTNIDDEDVQLQYSLDNGETWIDYTGEIEIEKNGTFKARAIIKNTDTVIGEAEKEITTVIEDVAMFKPGKEVSIAMMKLAGAGDVSWREYEGQLLLERPVKLWLVYDDNDREYYNQSIQAIKQATREQYETVKETLTESNIISIEDSLKPIYMWYDDNGTIYYYTEAEKLLTNQDSSCMFSGFLELSEIDLDDICTIKTTNMSQMFNINEGLQELDLSGFDTRNVTNMKAMFFELEAAQRIDVSSFDTSKVTDMSLMFCYNPSLTSLDVSNLDTSNVTSMDEMFLYCASLQSLDLSNFDTSNVTDMYAMFIYCMSLTELDVSNFDTSKVTNMWGMFAACQNLTTIYASENFDTSSVEDSTYMFMQSQNIIGGNGTLYSEEHLDKEYAVIDKPETPGYFTDVLNYLRCVIKLDGQPVSGKVPLIKGDSGILTVECTEDVTVTASDNSVVTLDEDGRLDVVGGGTATITVIGKETGKTKSITIIASRVFNVTYDKNGDDVTGTMEGSSLTDGQRLYLRSSQYSRTGYTFAGWNTKADGSGTSYYEGQSVTTFTDADENDNVTLYAQWTGYTYYIRFYATGGSGTMENQVMTYGTPATLTPNTFTKNNYIFAGWDTNYSGGGTSYTDGQEVNNLTTSNGGYVNLYAQWRKPNYTVVFNKNAEDATGTMENQVVSVGTTVNLTENSFTREEYIFKEWNTEADGSGTKYQDKQSISNLANEEGSVVNMYAQWNKTFKVIFNKNDEDATGTMENQIIGYGMATKLKENNFKKEGYYFSGWNTAPSGNGTAYRDMQLFELITEEDEDIIYLYAQWEKLEVVCSVKYAVQIYGINQDEDMEGNVLGLTFGPATGADYSNSYVTHEYEEIPENSKKYYVKIATHTISNENETISYEYLKNSDGENVIRTENEKNKYDINIHNMTWEQISKVPDKTVFLDCMLCGDTKGITLNLNNVIGSETSTVYNGDGAGFVESINTYYEAWNPSQLQSTSNGPVSNSYVGTGIELSNDEKTYGSNARFADGYLSSHVRATLIGKNIATNEAYAGDINVPKEACLYSCIEKDLVDVITPKKLKIRTSKLYNIGEPIWLFSVREVYGQSNNYTHNQYHMEEGLGENLEGYSKFGNPESKYYIRTYVADNTSDGTPNRTVYNSKGRGIEWWLRSVSFYDKVQSFAVTSGDAFTYGAYDNSTCGLAFGFCIK